MSTYTVVVLDTTAPVVTWGDPTGAVLGEELHVPYVSDEDLAYAELRLTDGRVLVMAITPTELVVQLPDDTPEGLAVIGVTDDVGNEAQHQVAVSGIIVVEPPYVPPTGLPHPPVVEPVPVTEAPSRVRASARYSVAATATDSSRLLTFTTWRSPGQRSWRWASRSVASTNWTAVQAQFSDPSHASSRTADTVDKRPEGPGAEEDLLILGLL
jgi:hypothetical protein